MAALTSLLPSAGTAPDTIRETPIRRQLIQMILVACAIVLLLTTAVFFVDQIVTFRQGSAQKLHTLGEAIATNSSAALTFDNPEDAAAVLAAFRADPHILAAALYDAQGQLFAAYPSAPPDRSRQTDSKPDVSTGLPSNLAPASVPGYFFKGGYLYGEQPVMEGGHQVGTLFVQSDLRAMSDQLRVFGLLDAVVIALSVLIAYLLSRQLQLRISRPILALADAARAVSDRRDYSQRALRTDSYELNLLTDAFNHMLTQTQDSESRLRAQLGHLHLLQHITRAIGDRQDLTNTFQIVLRSLEENLPIDFGCMCLFDDVAHSLMVRTVGAASLRLAADLGLVEGSRIPIDTNGLSQCILGHLVYEPDTKLVGFPFAERLARHGLRSVVLAPLMIETKIFGIVIAGRCRTDAFSSPESEFLRQLGEHVALATHQAQLHSALQQAYEDLRQTQATVMQQERLRALGQMASGIAHDINNAISPVALYTQSLLEREPDLSERTRSYLTTIQRAIEDVAGTVSRMREFYRQREPELVQACINLNDTIPQVIAMTRARWSDQPQQRGHMIELRTELSEAPARIMAAEGEIRDALTNLIFNAVDAMPEGGTLTLRTRVVGGKAPADSKHLYLEVSDSGIGMDEPTRRRCLEPFFTTKGERGTGLGLAMVYGMIQRHSAELEVDSALGQGTTIRCIFPLFTEAFSSTISLPTLPVPPRSLRLLLVDDDPLILKAMQHILEGDGHNVTATSGGQAGIEAFVAALQSANPFSLVITDLGMPHVDGRMVAARIRAASAQVPIIMMTGWGQRLIAENAIPEHVNRVLGKPPRLAELRAALAELSGPSSASLSHPAAAQADG